MLSIRALSKTYRQGALHALTDVSLDIGDGEFTALLGQNGAGKTTLLNILMGLVPPDAGTVLLDGESLLSGKRYLKSRLGIVPQELVTDFLFTVEEVLTLYSGFYGIRNNKSRIDYLLDRLSLSDKKDQRIQTLSGGMKRRLLIARALVHKPDILLLDEPTAGVDINLRRDMYDFLRELNEGGMTIILTTHYLEEAENLCSRILMLKNGRLVADKPKEDFLRLTGDKLVVEVTFARPLDEYSGGWPDMAASGAGTPRTGRFHLPRTELSDMFQRLADRKDDIEDIRIAASRLEDVFLDIANDQGSSGG